MEPRSGCAINVAVEALGDHWSLPDACTSAMLAP
jgi:hypothetical protein